MQTETASLLDERPDSPGVRLPAGTTLTRLVTHVDGRGMVAEIFGANWPTGIAPVKWSTSVSGPGVLRGMRVHNRHDDYLCLVQGRMFVALCDLRSGSPTERMSASFEMTGEELSSLFIPHGVAHGFYLSEPSVHVLGTSHYFDLDDELGFHWADPGLKVTWPTDAPELSERDAALGTLDEVLPRIGRWRHE